MPIFVPDCQNCPDPAIIGLISYSVKCYIGANLCFEICETVAIKAGTQSATLHRMSWSIQSMVNWCRVSLAVHYLSVLVAVSKQKRLLQQVTCFQSSACHASVRGWEEWSLILLLILLQLFTTRHLHPYCNVV